MLAKGPLVTHPPPVPWGRTMTRHVSVFVFSKVTRLDVWFRVGLTDLGRGTVVRDDDIRVRVVHFRAVSRQRRRRAVKHLGVGESFLCGLCPIPVRN